MIDWIDINKEQPPNYKTVLFYCEGGRMLVGMYYGGDHYRAMQDSKENPLHKKSRKRYGKYGRYCEPAEDYYKVTH